jgi:hypothetical protein
MMTIGEYIMSVTYKWKNLAEVAAYFEGRAVHLREQIESAKPKQVAELRHCAAAYEDVAHVLRNTILGDA